MAASRYDWDKLKAEFIASEDASVRAFCIRRGVGDPRGSSYLMQKTVGWAKQKEKVRTAATEKFIAMATDEMMLDTKRVRLEQAKIAGEVIKKASKYLLEKSNKIVSVEQARRLLETGVKMQRDALGMNTSPGKDPKLTQINIDMSRFGIEDADEEELLKIVGAIRSARRKISDSVGERSEEEAG